MNAPGSLGGGDGGVLLGRSSLSEINVTPLVDVILVLLIIFMVTAPMMHQGIDVALPQTSERPFDPGTQDRYVITVAADQKVYLNESEIPLEQLESKLRQLSTPLPLQGLFFKADERVPYGVVVQVMDKIKLAGIQNLGMVTRPVDEETGR